MAVEPYCAACCGPADNLCGIRPHPAQDLWYCHRCWGNLSERDRGLVRICLEMTTLVGAAVLEREPADWLVEADEAERCGLVMAPSLCKSVAAWAKAWRETAPRSVREAVGQAIAQGAP